MKYKLMSNSDNTLFIKSLEPFELASEFEAMVISHEQLTAIMYVYGLEEDYTAIEI